METEHENTGPVEDFEDEVQATRPTPGPDTPDTFEFDDFALL